MKVKLSELFHCDGLPARRLSTLSRYPATGFAPPVPGHETKIIIGQMPTEPNEKPIPEPERCYCSTIREARSPVFASMDELALIDKEAPGEPLARGYIQVQGANFAMLPVKTNGECQFLGTNGCRLGERKPLWCKARTIQLKS